MRDLGFLTKLHAKRRRAVRVLRVRSVIEPWAAGNTAVESEST